jgi:phage terminase large subunit GpA-like protein
LTAQPSIESFEPVSLEEVLKRVADAEAAASLLPGLARPEDVERDGFVVGFKPDERLPVSQHAQRYRVLSGTATAEPGPWNNDRTPYLVEPMDCLSTSSSVSEVALCFGAQLGKTELGLNFTSYVIDAAPGPMLLCQPTVEMGKRVSSQRIKPLIQESPRLRSKVRDSRSRDSGNTTLSKEFPGGILVITGANSGAGLRSMPVRFLFLDEVDAYPLTIPGEGSPIGLALARTRTFRNKRKILMTSTPVEESTSVIWRAYRNADMRRYFMPCPHCNEEITFEFERLRWEKGNPKSVHYKCQACKKPIQEWQKTEMLAKGRWKPTRTDIENVDPTRRSYHLSSLYSPVGWLGWDEIAEKWEAAEGDIEAAKEFRNTILALPWMEVGTRVDWEVLHGRRDVSGYLQEEVPDEALFLTAGADVGQDHVEVGVWGWGRDRRRFAVDHFRISGGYNEPSTWAQVTDSVLRTYKNRAGVTFGLEKYLIDAREWPAIVKNWVRTQNPAIVMAVNGRDDMDVAVKVDIQKEAIPGIPDKKTRVGALRIAYVGVSYLKGEFMSALKLERPKEKEPLPPGWVNIPMGDRMSIEFCRQLVAEQHIVTRLKSGKVTERWEKLPGRRNEALDCHNYARAGASLIGWDRFQEPDFLRYERKIEEAIAEMKAAAAAEARGTPLPVTPSAKVGVARRQTIQQAGMVGIAATVAGRRVSSSETQGSAQKRVVPLPRAMTEDYDG